MEVIFYIHGSKAKLKKESFTSMEANKNRQILWKTQLVPPKNMAQPYVTEKTHVDAPTVARQILNEFQRYQHGDSSLVCVRGQSPTRLTLVPCTFSAVYKCGRKMVI